MNKQEILDAINATIAPNNVKGITAEALANILTEIVNAMGTGSGAGGEYIDVTQVNPDNETSIELTPEAMAHNAEVYAKLSSALSSGGAVPSVSIDLNIGGLVMYAKSIAPDPAGGVALYFDMMIDEINVGVDGMLMDTMEPSMVVIGSNNVLLKIVVYSDGSFSAVVPNFA